MRLLGICLIAACFAAGLSAVHAAALPALPDASESFDCGSFHVDRYGSGARTIVFIPGLASGPWSWAEAIGQFSKSNTVNAITLAGFDGHPA